MCKNNGALSLFGEWLRNWTMFAPNIEIILDGASVPAKSCMKGRFEPFVATWTPPTEAPIGAFFNNRSTSDENRFAVMNIPVYSG